MLRKLKAEEDKQGLDLDFPGFRTHPNTQKRIDRLEAKWKKLKQKSGFIEFAAQPVETQNR